MVNQDGTGRHRIFCLMGKSGTGKDTIYRELLSDGALPFERLVPCTTRPIRAGEQNGREYHFYSVEEFRALERVGKVIESRCYETVHGPWYYFTADDGQIDLASRRRADRPGEQEYTYDRNAGVLFGAAGLLWGG